MKYYKVTADFQIVRYANTLDEAERIFNEMVRDKMSYVELSLVIDEKTYTSHSWKIYC